MYFDSIPTISLTDLKLNSISLEKLPQYSRRINIPISASADFEVEADIDSRAFSKVFGLDPDYSVDSFSMTFKKPYQEQVRKHKKKRINKKWAKRYGYRTKFKTYQVDEVHFTDNGCFQIEATCSNLHLI